MSKEELFELVAKECKENGWYYSLRIDDGDTIKGQYSVITNSKLHKMVSSTDFLYGNEVHETTY